MTAKERKEAQEKGLEFLRNAPHEMLVAYINSHWDAIFERGLADIIYSDEFIREKIVPIIYRNIAEGKENF